MPKDVYLSIKATLFLFLSSFYASACFAQTEFRISPPIVEVSLGRGGTKVFSFDLSNDNKERTLEFKIFAVDLEMDRNGNTEFLEAGKSNYSCSKWIQLEPNYVILEPGKSKKITGKLSVPAAALAGGYYSAVTCELVTKKPVKLESGAAITWRIASLMKVTVLGGRLEKKAVLEDLRLRTLFETEEERRGITFLASLRNEGNIHIKAEGRLTVLTPDRRRKGEIDFDVGTGTVLPEHTRDFVAVYDKFLTEGEYLGRATFRYGGMRALEKEIPFSVKIGKPTGEKGEAVIIPSLKLIPEEMTLKVPAGGFRTAGFTIQNQRIDNLRIQISLDKEAGIQDWFKIEPQEVKLEGGKEAKVLLKINVPPEAKEGTYKNKIKLTPFLLTTEGQEESLEPEDIKITLEVPKF